jgi:hypothetical protein
MICLGSVLKRMLELKKHKIKQNRKDLYQNAIEEKTSLFSL